MPMTIRNGLDIKLNPWILHIESRKLRRFVFKPFLDFVYGDGVFIQQNKRGLCFCNIAHTSPLGTDILPFISSNISSLRGWYVISVAPSQYLYNIKWMYIINIMHCIALSSIYIINSFKSIVTYFLWRQGIMGR